MPIGHIDFKGGSPSSFGTKCISEDVSNASMTERIISVWCENEKKKKKSEAPQRVFMATKQNFELQSSALEGNYAGNRSSAFSFGIQ